MKNTETLSMVTQTLAITSQVLAISIEVAIIAGGIYIYRKIAVSKEPDAVLVPSTSNVVPINPPKTTWKQRFNKIKNIAKAVMD